MRKVIVLLKFIVFLIVVVVIANVLLSRTVSDAIINFCFAGVVPGTNHVLSPDEVLKLVLAALCIVVSILAIMMVRALSIRRRQMKQSSVAAASIESPSKQQAQPKLRSKKRQKQPAVRFVQRQMLAASRLVGTLVRPLRQQAFVARLLKALAKLQVLANRLYKTCRPYLIAISARIWQAVQQILALCRRGIQWAQKASFRIAQEFWRWLRPHAYALDTWLELQCRAGISWWSKQWNKSERAAIFGLIAKETSKSLRQITKSRKR